MSLVDSTLVRPTGRRRRRAMPRRLMVGTGQKVTTHVVPDEGTLSWGAHRSDDPRRRHLRVAPARADAPRRGDARRGSRQRQRHAGGRRAAAPNQPTSLPPGQVVEIGSSWLMVANAPLTASRAAGAAAASRAAGARPPAAHGRAWSCSTRRCARSHELIERAALSRHQRAAARRDRRRQGGVRATRSTRCRRAPTSRSSGSTAPRSPSRCSRASCSATRRARSPARPGQAGPARDRRRRHRASSTRSARCRSPSRPSCCACSRSARCCASAARRPRPIDVRFLVRHEPRPGGRDRAGSFRRDLFFRLNGITLDDPAAARAAVGDRAARAPVRRSRGAAASARRPRDRRRRAGSGFAATSGPATSASCATSWSAPSCCRRAALSPPTSCRPTRTSDRCPSRKSGADVSAGRRGRRRRRRDERQRILRRARALRGEPDAGGGAARHLAAHAGEPAGRIQSSHARANAGSKPQLGSRLGRSRLSRGRRPEHAPGPRRRCRAGEGMRPTVGDALTSAPCELEGSPCAWRERTARSPVPARIAPRRYSGDPACPCATATPPA